MLRPMQFIVGYVVSVYTTWMYDFALYENKICPKVMDASSHQHSGRFAVRGVRVRPASSSSS